MWEQVEETLIGADLGAELSPESSPAPRRTDVPPRPRCRLELLGLFATRQPPHAAKAARPSGRIIGRCQRHGQDRPSPSSPFASGRARRVLLARHAFRAAPSSSCAVGYRIDVPVVSQCRGADPRPSSDAMDDGRRAPTWSS
jgi:hypothetical protein